MAERALDIAMVDAAAFTLPYDTALCEALARRGHTVTLYTTRFPYGPMPAARGYRIAEWFYRRQLPALGQRASRALQHPFDLLRLRREIRRRGHQVVHLQWRVVEALDLRFVRSLRAATVFTAHNAVSRQQGDRTADCGALESFDAVVVHSDHGEQALRGSCPQLRNLWRIPHGAFDHMRDIEAPDSPPLQLGEGPMVAMAGLLRPYKGVDVLLEAWPHVRERIPDAQLVIAGRPLGVTLPSPLPAGVVALPRFVDDGEFSWILRRANVVCLPYRGVDLSGVLFSALALGRPLVMSDVGGFSEFEGRGARLVPPGDSPALAQALVDVLANPDEQERLAQQARASADSEFGWDSIAEQYEQRYLQLLQEQRA